jgi:hypothetical protein
VNDPLMQEVAKAMVKADPRLALIYNIKTLEEAARIFMKRMKIAADLKAKED